ncbi:CPBP family intramembrane glutamic endopeptidase [Staphylococcus agnetis]|uniref:CPBP family intramembrane glutamic endopeptidase n=1 Tax=Staphylococcus agnetis TaxID=985762 RepID=UPI00143017F7|nr:CPBP family intramembrane glutamic endopeptidase [Staphylococcus agnetis]NJH98798.1 CPBP family intramembrane metalloprotease [Staphylococcus agnetis]
MIPLIPIFIITIATLSINFALSIAYLLPIIDAILIAVAEEGMFRGILLGGLARYIKPIYAVFISAFLFMSLHFLNVLAVVGGFIGAWLGKKMFNKHFKKAGLV